MNACHIAERGMGKGILGLLLVAALALSAPPSHGQGAGPETYVHPRKKFALAVPPGAKVEERGGKAGIVIRSPRGYLIKLQTGPADPAADLDAMAAKLEALYLGQGKPWTENLSRQKGTLHGMPTNDLLYKGSNTQTRVVIARGLETDFVFMFFAPPREFAVLGKDFDWLLENFRPAASEIPEPPAVDEDSKETGPSATPAQPPRFSDAGLGYNIEYPPGFVITRPALHTVMFSGREGSNAFDAVVSIRNVTASPTEGSNKAAAVFADLKSQIAAATTSVRYIGETAIVYGKGGLNLEGRQFLVTYTLEGRRFRKWAVVTPRPSGEVVHIWSYTAPVAIFEMFRSLAQRMRDTWTIHLNQ